MSGKEKRVVLLGLDKCLAGGKKKQNKKTSVLNEIII